MFVLVKDALADVSPLLFNLLRMALAGSVLLAVYWRHLQTLPRSGWLVGILAGVLLAAGYQCQTAGLQFISPSKSAFLTGMVVIFVPFLSLSPYLRAPGAGRPPLAAFLGAVLGFLGLALLALPADAPWALASLLSIGRGELLTIVCALAFALHLLTLAHGAHHTDFQPLAVVQITTAAIVMLITLPVFEPHPFFHPHAAFVAAWLVSGLLATAAAFSIQSWAQRFIPASHTALILALEPVFAAATSFLFLGERLHGRALLGAALVMAAIGVSELLPAGGPAGGVVLSTHEAAPPEAPAS